MRIINQSQVKCAWRLTSLTLVSTMVFCQLLGAQEDKAEITPPLKGVSPQDVHLAEALGSIQSTFEGGRDKLVIVIEDTHASIEAQKKIAGILEYFYLHYSLRHVSLEGAEGNLFTEMFSFFPDRRTRENMSDFLLRMARLTGPEYLAIVKYPDLSLYGIEDQTVYEENRKAYLEAIEFQKQDQNILKHLGLLLDGLAKEVFSEELMNLRTRQNNFEKGGREFIGYVRYLTEKAKKLNVALYDYPEMYGMLELVELEEKIDFDSANQDMEMLIDDLKNVISRDKLSRFLMNTVQFRMKKMRRADYYGYLENEIGTIQEGRRGVNEAIDAKYENVIRYLKYVNLYDKIGLNLIEEVAEMEKAIKNKIFRSEEEVELDYLYRIFDVYLKLFNFSMTADDAAFFYRFRKEFKSSRFVEILSPLLKKYKFSYGLPSQLEVLDQDLLRIERYYDAVLKRDNILIEKAVGKMQEENIQIMAMVTGGFHSPGIEQFLRQKDYSYLVIKPVPEKIETSLEEAKLYEDALRNRPIGFERSLVDSFFPSDAMQVSGIRSQLAAERFVVPVGEGARLLTEMSALFQRQGDSNIEAIKRMNASREYFEKEPRRENVVFAMLLFLAESSFQAGDPIFADAAVRLSLRSVETVLKKQGAEALADLSIFNSFYEKGIKIYDEDRRGRKLIILSPGILTEGDLKKVRWIVKVPYSDSYAVREIKGNDQFASLSDGLIATGVVEIDDVATIMKKPEFNRAYTFHQIRQINARERVARLVREIGAELQTFLSEASNLEKLSSATRKQFETSLGAIHGRPLRLFLKKKEILEFASRNDISIPESQIEDPIRTAGPFMERAVDAWNKYHAEKPDIYGIYSAERSYYKPGEILKALSRIEDNLVEKISVDESADRNAQLQLENYLDAAEAELSRHRETLSYLEILDGKGPRLMTDLDAEPIRELSNRIQKVEELILKGKKVFQELERRLNQPSRFAAQ